jgi:hypothetical protein
MKRLLLLSTVAILALPAAGAQAATGHTVDLVSGRVDGHRILGRTVAGVTAALGRPDFRAGTRSYYRIGWGSPSDFSIEVLFHRSGRVQRAWSIVFERGPVRDVKLGDLLQHRSAALQAAIRAHYRDTFKLLRPYACKSGSTCVGEFAARSGSLHLSFGTQPVTGTWLTVWQPLASA